MKQQEGRIQQTALHNHVLGESPRVMYMHIAAHAEPQAVARTIRSARENGIETTALHSHMLDEQPRLFFMHFWGNDDALRLARGLRAAIERTNSRRPPTR